MIAITTRELTKSGDKYFDLAMTQPVFLRRRKKLFRLQVADGNPSPSNDPYFLHPENVAAITRGAKQVEEKKVTRLTPELKKNLFSDV
ncbi:MAG: hypothetical protein LBU62_06945 [Bacteroidales bacterium]|jgi:hypothetical protein|nr:hypothetical protein [Bacteroidales bacterium]